MKKLLKIKFDELSKRIEVMEKLQLESKDYEYLIALDLRLNEVKAQRALITELLTKTKEEMNYKEVIEKRIYFNELYLQNASKEKDDSKIMAYRYVKWELEDIMNEFEKRGD